MQVTESNTHIHQTESKTETVLTTLVGNKFTITIIDATAELPSQMILLRDDVLVSELMMLNPDELLISDDHFGTHVLLYENATGRMVGATHVAPAEQITFMHYAGYDAQELANSVLSRSSVIAKNYRSRGLLHLLLSAAANFYVQRGRNKVITYLPEDTIYPQRRFNLTPVAEGSARKVQVQSGQTFCLKPFFISFEHLLHLDVNLDQEVKDLIYKIRSFDWFSQNTGTISAFNVSNQNIGLDRT